MYNSPLVIFIWRSLKVICITLGDRKSDTADISLCQHWQISLETGKWDTSCLSITCRASPSTKGNWEEQYIQPIGNKEKVKNRFWLVKEFWKLANGNYKLASVNTSQLSKKKLIGMHLVWSHKIFNKRKGRKHFKVWHTCPNLCLLNHTTPGKSYLWRRSLFFKAAIIFLDIVTVQ